MTKFTARLGIVFSLAAAAGLCVLAVMRAAAAEEAANPLRMQTRMLWPASISTVGEAARYVLAPTGYQLVTAPPAPREAPAIAARAISPRALQLRTLPIDEALLAIAGPDTKLVVDTHAKLVSFGHAADRREP